MKEFSILCNALTELDDDQRDRLKIEIRPLNLNEPLFPGKLNEVDK